MTGERSNKTVVITGVSSFIGFHVARYLSCKNWRVIGTISQDIRDYDFLRHERLLRASRAGVDLRLLDITNVTVLREFIKSVHPTIWIHHAGWAKDYQKLEYNLDQGHSINVTPLYELFSSLSENGCRGVIVTGSSAEYGDSDSACHEEDACWPMTPYGLSKLSETIRSYQLAHEFKLSTRIARVFIPYGSLDAPGKVIPSVIKALREGKPIELSSCEQFRDFLYIDDLCCGYQALIEDLNRDVLFDLFNLCHGQATQLSKLLLNFADILDTDPNLLVFGKRPLRPGEAKVSYGSNRKALSTLDWQPSSLEKGLQAYLQGEMTNQE